MKNMLQVIILLSFVACSKTIESVPEFEYANYAAVVQCYDEFGFRIDNSGIEVSVDSLDYLSTRTDETGYFQLKVPVGTYSFNYSKEGFSDHWHLDVTLIGGIQPVIYFEARMYKPVDVMVSQYNLIYDLENDRITAEGFAESETPFQLLLGFKTDLNSDLDKVFSIAYYDSVYKNGVSFSGGIGFLGQNLDETDVAYMALYSKNTFEYPTYSTLTQVTDFVRIELVK